MMGPFLATWPQMVSDGVPPVESHRQRPAIIELRHEEFAHLFNAQSPFAYKILDNLVMDLVDAPNSDD